MEVAARNTCSVLLEDERVVRDRVDLNVHSALHILHSVLGSAVDLRAAAERVCVLHANLTLAGRVLRVCEQTTQVLCGLTLTLVRANRMDSVLECIHDTVLRLKAERIRNVGNL